jgi:hypothetical protein
MSKDSFNTEFAQENHGVVRREFSHAQCRPRAHKTIKIRSQTELAQRDA